MTTTQGKLTVVLTNTSSEDDDKRSQRLWEALQHGSYREAQYLIANGANMAFAFDGSTVMCAALTNGQNSIINECSMIQCAKLLLDAGVSIDAVCDYRTQNRPIHCIAYGNLSSVLMFFVENGVDVNSLNGLKMTALHISALQNFVGFMSILIENGAYLYVEDKWKSNPMQYAVAADSKEAVKLLVESGFNVNYISSDGATPLAIAVVGININMVDMLLNLGADPNLQADCDLSPLSVMAAKLCWPPDKKMKVLKIHEDIATLLVSKGGNLNHPEYCNPPLKIAIERNWIGLAKLFVSLGASVSCGTNYSLFHRVAAINSDIIEVFLDHGADYNSFHDNNESPYHVAIKHKVDIKYIKCFVKNGCPYNQNLKVFKKLSKRLNSDTKHFVAAEKKFFEGIKANNLELVKCALDEGAVVNGTSEEIQYPIHYVVSHDYKDLLYFLLAKGAFPNSLNDQRESPLYVAAKLGHYYCCFSLLKFGACCTFNKLLKNTEIQSPAVVSLLRNVKKLFGLTSIGSKRVITKLQQLFKEDVALCLVYLNARNAEGNTLLSVAVDKQHSEIALELIKLRLNSNAIYSTQVHLSGLIQNRSK